MGIFDSWNVSGITTDGAKLSEPFYILAQAIQSDDESEIPLEHLLVAAKTFIDLNNSFDLFFDKGVKSFKTDAVKFLVQFAAFSMGKDYTGWSWQEVRNLSQGLYTSMKDSPAHFLHYNTPLIENANNEITYFIEKHS
jgi:hypothetical protein